MTVVDQRKVHKIRNELLGQDGALRSAALLDRPSTKTASTPAQRQTSVNLPPAYNAVVAVGATTPNKSPTVMPSTQMVRETHKLPALGAAPKIEPDAHPAPPPYDPAARESHSSSEKDEAGTATIAGPEASAPPPPYSHAVKTRTPPAIDAATIAEHELPAESAGSPRPPSSASPPTHSASSRSSSALPKDAGRGEPDDSAAGLQRESCNVCGKQASSMPGAKLFTCSRCSSVFYCSAACQQKHWPSHRGHCQPQGHAV